MILNAEIFAAVRADHCQVPAAGARGPVLGGMDCLLGSLMQGIQGGLTFSAALLFSHRQLAGLLYKAEQSCAITLLFLIFYAYLNCGYYKVQRKRNV